ncbi:hypothetical protein CYY_001211 [Polysphondylium violaceum]|uniref:Transmembrane protein n=1 Tax=Polysphondylium violaceum TaxID=133409 RepID=A0A8J4Q2F2_9MYCE|nr:hypothetical protein CYY_001211 [Polysphondylium violaceum]
MDNIPHHTDLGQQLTNRSRSNSGSSPNVTPRGPSPSTTPRPSSPSGTPRPRSSSPTGTPRGSINIHGPSPLQFTSTNIQKDSESDDSSSSSSSSDSSSLDIEVADDAARERENNNIIVDQTVKIEKEFPISASTPITPTTTPNSSTNNVAHNLNNSNVTNKSKKSQERLEDAVSTHNTSNSHINATHSIRNFIHSLYNSTDEEESDSDGFDDEMDEIEDKKDSETNEKVGIEMRELSGEKNPHESKKYLREFDGRRLKLPLLLHLLEICKDYSLSLFVALIGTIICIILSYAYSSPEWLKRSNGTTDYFHHTDYAMLVSTFFVGGLAIFTLIQFISVYGIKRMVETKFYLWVIGVIGLFMLVPWSFFAGDVTYWYWLGDVILLIIGYTGLCFVMGYVGKSYQTHKERLSNGFAFLGTEILVSATALMYGMFMIQLYIGFSNIAKIAWRLVIHPIYFEVLMMIPVRLLVTKQMEKKGANIMHSLAVVHAQAHISTLGRMMISTINEIEFTVVSVILLNIGKLVFRSSVQLRDKAANRVLKKVMGKENQESKRFVRAVGLYTEMIMENASIPASAFTMWTFYNIRGLFFFPYPDSGEFTLADATINVAIQLGIAFVFDILTLLINERYFHLPLDRAWKRMKEKWLPFFGFLLYGLISMGSIGIIYMACRVPRFLTCDTQDVCSCKFVKDCDDFIATQLT